MLYLTQVLPILYFIYFIIPIIKFFQKNSIHNFDEFKYLILIIFGIDVYMSKEKLEKKLSQFPNKEAWLELNNSLRIRALRILIFFIFYMILDTIIKKI